MTQAVAVIGSMYGDEGKGLMTDYYCTKVRNPITIRYNGGAQAGHTVQLQDGRRHIFSHFGSGSFVNAPTYLSEYFVIHPTLFVRELDELTKINVIPTVYASEKCLITTPFDMIINQVVENRRGANRHGSVGVGFSETFDRSEYVKLTLRDLIYDTKDQILDKLLLIRDRWVPSRIQECQNEQEEMVYNAINNDSLIEDFYKCCIIVQSNVARLEFKDISAIHRDPTLVFEGAQGLMLDQTYGIFPHVTRSNTGTKNIVQLLDSIKNQVEELVVNYVSRTYTTRHGAGPLINETNFPDYIVDNTNHFHLFQGHLRYSPLDMDTMIKMIELDLGNLTEVRYNIIEKMTFTCLDQLGKSVPFYLNGELNSLPKHKFETIIRDMSDFVSYGPTRKHIKKIR